MAKTPRHPATARVIEAAGGVYETANKLGISAAAVSKWNLIPERWVSALSDLTGLPPSEIRPADATGGDGTQHGENTHIG